jgi:Uma2 family endonuclease
MERATQVVKPVPEGEMTFEEFLAWGDEDTHAEWVKGKVIPKMPASVKHQQSNSFLHLLIGSWAQFHQVQMPTVPTLTKDKTEEVRSWNLSALS